MLHHNRKHRVQHQLWAEIAGFQFAGCITATWLGKSVFINAQDALKSGRYNSLKGLTCL